MSFGRGNFAYSQARLQARLGQAADRGELLQAQAAGDFASFLGTVRATSLRRYAARLAPGMEPHAIERHLREEWCQLVAEVARWQPPAWRESLLWLRWLPYLPALQKLARGGRPPAWTRADPLLGRLVATEPALRGATLARAALQPFAAALADAGDVTAAWLAHWRRLWPDPPASRRGLTAIVQALGAFAATLQEVPPGAGSRGAQRVLAQRLMRILRRNPLSPAAAVSYLGLEALGLLELRGGALRRAAVTPGPA